MINMKTEIGIRRKIKKLQTQADNLLGNYNTTRVDNPHRDMFIRKRNILLEKVEALKWVIGESDG